MHKGKFEKSWPFLFQDNLGKCPKCGWKIGSRDVQDEEEPQHPYTKPQPLATPPERILARNIKVEKKTEKQSASKYASISMDNLWHYGVVMYNEKAPNPNKIWGSLIKARYAQGPSYWFITEHQLTDDVYVKHEGKEIRLKTIEGWEQHNTDDLAFCTLPANKLSLTKTHTWVIATVDNQTSFGMFISTSLETKNPQLAITDLKLHDGFLEHSATTANCYCGSPLFNAHGQLLGLHVGTKGPSTKGFNNRVIPLKY